MQLIFPVLVIVTVILACQLIQKKSEFPKKEMQLSRQIKSLLLLASPVLIFFIIIMVIAICLM